MELFHGEHGRLARVLGPKDVFKSHDAGCRCEEKSLPNIGEKTVIHMMWIYRCLPGTVWEDDSPVPRVFIRSAEVRYLRRCSCRGEFSVLDDGGSPFQDFGRLVLPQSFSMLLSSHGEWLEIRRTRAIPEGTSSCEPEVTIVDRIPMKRYQFWVVLDQPKST
jgi:hypothetical protein